jgi:hypothetical protein
MLAGASPSPPQGLETRVLRALEAERPSGRLRGWTWRLAPVLGTLAVGVVLGALIGRQRALDDRQGAPVQCAAALPRSIVLDLDAYTRAADVPPGEIEVRSGRSTLRLPRRLLARGPYRPDETLLVSENGAACLPLRAAYGYTLLLSVAPLDRPASSPRHEMRIESDPARVFYRRVWWVSGGHAWTLEGRAEAAELLDLAHELAAHSAVSS